MHPSRIKQKLQKDAIDKNEDDSYLKTLPQHYRILLIGNKYQTVFCIVDVNAKNMLEKRLLYTAISRAKKQLFIIGNKSLFETQVRLKLKRIRQTTLQERIYESIQNISHFKGNNYKVLCVAMHTETQEMMVVYQALYGDYKYFVRPYEMFVSKVDHDKYPDVKQEYRFELVEEQAQVYSFSYCAIC